MAEYPQKLQELLDLFAMIEDRGERIQLLIDIAERFREVPHQVATRPFGEDHRVPHCESEAFVWALREGDDSLRFYFAVENPQGISARAMAVILDESLSGSAAADVVSVPGDLPYQIFGRELSMGKNMGLMGMVAMVQASAKKFLRQGASPQ